jgi:hypothetical protein
VTSQCNESRNVYGIVSYMIEVELIVNQTAFPVGPRLDIALNSFVHRTELRLFYLTDLVARGISSDLLPLSVSLRLLLRCFLGRFWFLSLFSCLGPVELSQLGHVLHNQIDVEWFGLLLISKP